MTTRRALAVITTAAILTTSISVTTAITSAAQQPNPQGLWTAHSQPFAQGWNFDNKNKKNKKRRVIHRGGW